MNQRLPELQDLGEQFELAVRRAESSGEWTYTSARLPRWVRGARRRLWSWIGAGGVAVAAAVTAFVLLLSSGAPAAFAGWTQTPTAISATALAGVREACGHVPPADVVAAESRGPFTAIVYLRSGTPWQCVTRGPQVLMRQSTAYPPKVVVSPASGNVSPPVVTHTVIGAAANESLRKLYKRDDMLYRTTRAYEQAEKLAAGPKGRALRVAETKILLGPNSMSAVSGSVGAGVSGITFILRDGTQVKATVGHGWYFAWWPGSSKPNGSIPTSIRVTAQRGKTTTPYTADYLLDLFRPCLAFQLCRSGPWAIKLRRGVSPSITEHFGLFRNTKPVSSQDAKSVARLFLGSMIGAKLGLAPSQARKVSLGVAGTMWVTPGTEGACVKIGSATDANAPDTGGGGCTNLAAILQKGLIIGGDQSVFGLVADGNGSVSVCMTSGRHITLAVNHNVFYGTLPGRPGIIYLKNAYGRPTHQLEWVSKHC